MATRDIAAPRDVVWAAWTDRSRFAEWWVPDGFATTTDAYDLYPGGTWTFTAHGPDGTDRGNCIAFETVNAISRLTYAYYAEGNRNGHPRYNARVDLAEITHDGGRNTRLTTTPCCTGRATWQASPTCRASASSAASTTRAARGSWR